MSELDASQGAPQGEAVEHQPEQTPEPGTGNTTQHEQQPAERPAEETEADKIARRAARADALEKQLQYERRHSRRREAEYERRLQERQAPERHPPEHQRSDADVETRAHQIAEEREQARRLQTWGETGEKDIPDFHEKCNTVAQLVGDRKREFMGTVLEMDDGHKAVAYLADHPEDAMRIFDLPPRRMAIELGKLSEKGFAPKQPPQSSAPPPIKPITGASRGERDDSKLSDAEWYANWQKEHGRKG